MAAFETTSTSYKEIFPAGHPFKSLYAVYAMKEYIESARRREYSKQPDGDVESVITYTDALRRAVSLIAAAISDKDVTEPSSSERIEESLNLCLMNFLVQLLIGILLLDIRIQERSLTFSRHRPLLWSR